MASAILNTTKKKVPDTTGLVGFRDYSAGKGFTVGADDKGVNLNGSLIDTTGLVNKDNKFYGTVDQLNSIYSKIPGKEVVAGNTTVNTTPVAATTDNKGYVSPYQEKILSMLDGYLKPPSFNFDWTKDANYANAQREGQRTFNNQIGDMSAITGGRLNSWATSSAAQAQNDYMGNAMAQAENSAYNRYQNDYQNIAKQLQMLQGLEKDSYNSFRDSENDKYNKQQDERKNYASTVGQFADNYQGEINNVLNDGDPSNDWKAEIAGTARQGKKAEINAKVEADKAKKEAATTVAKTNDYNKAWDRFTTIGYVKTDADSKVLGIPKGTKTSSQQNIEADNARMGQERKQTQVQQSGNNYNQFLSDASDAGGEDIINALASGETGLTKGTAEYNKALVFGQNKFYDDLVSKFNSGTPMYQDSFLYRLNQPAYGVPNYYKDLLGSKNYNKLIATSKTLTANIKTNKEKADKAAFEKRLKDNISKTK